MPVSVAYAREATFPEYPALCRSLAGLLVSAKRASRTTGTEIIERYDAAAGAAAARDREAELAGWLDRYVQARPESLERIRKRVPPTAREARAIGVKSPKVVAQIRGERFEGWTLERLLAALDACGYEATIAVRPKPVA